MAQTKSSHRRFAAHSKGFRQNFIKAFTLLNTQLKSTCFGFKIFIAERLQAVFELIDALDVFLEIAQIALVTAAEQFGKQLIEHG